MKLATNRKTIKLPRFTNSVEETFHRSMKKAKHEGWNKIVIIGEGKTMGSFQTNGLIDTIASGLCAKAMKRICDYD